MTLQGPKLYPDELVSSGLIRCCRNYGLSTKPLRSVVLEVRYWQARFLFINSLPSLARVFRMAEDVLLWEHTTFPYASAYLDDETLRGAIDCVGRDAAGPRLGAISQNATVGQGFRRYCPECASQDVHAYGETFWHRAHHLPGVVVCAIHGMYLRATKIPINLSTRLALELPGESSTRPAGRGFPPSSLTQLARDSSAALASRPGSRPGPRSAENYRAIARTHGWLRDGAQVSGLRLGQLLAETFGSTFLSQWGVKPEAAQSSWPGLMLRDRSCVPFVPLKHLLLNIALSSSRGDETLGLNHCPPGPSARRASEVDAVFSRSARAVLKRLTACGATGVTTESFLREAGCWQGYRHRLPELPRLRSVVLKFRSSAVSVKPLGVGKTLYRTLPAERITG